MVPSNTKKFIAGLLLFLLARCEHATAQNYLRDDGQFHSVVEGTTTGQCLANTGGSLTGVLCAGVPAGLSGQVQFNSSGAFAGNAGFTYVAGGALTIAPTANTLNQGLTTIQSGPNSGSTAGPQSFNLVAVTDNNNTLTGGSSLDAFGILNVNSAAWRVNDTVTGSGGTPRYAGIFAVNYTGTGGASQPVGLMGSAYSNANPASLWGVIGHAALGSSASANFITGFSAEVGAAAGSTLIYRAALTAFSEGPVQGSTLDAVFVLATEAITGTPAGFKNVIAIANNFSGTGAPVLDAAANIISADSATTIANAFKLDNFTITGNIISTPNLTINGTGGAYFGTNTAPTAHGLFVSGPSMGVLSSNPSTNTASGFDYFQTVTSAADNQVALLVAEAANGGTFFNQTINNWSMIRAAGANNQGLIIGTAGALPLLFGTANTTRAEIYGAGGFAMAVSGTPIANPGDGNIAATRYFSGTTGGLASKSCIFNTTNVTTGITLTITGGLVTGTTTC